MARITKDQARQEAELYAGMLSDSGIISDISSEEVRGKMQYSFLVYDPTYTYQVDCTGIVEVARVLTCMWSAFSRARYDIGLS